MDNKVGKAVPQLQTHKSTALPLSNQKKNVNAAQSIYMATSEQVGPRNSIKAHNSSSKSSNNGYSPIKTHNSVNK